MTEISVKITLWQQTDPSSPWYTANVCYWRGAIDLDCCPIDINQCINPQTTVSIFRNVIFFACVHCKCDLFYMNLVQYNQYLVSTVDTDGLVLWHQVISSHSAKNAPMHSNYLWVKSLPNDVLTWKHFPHDWPFVKGTCWWIPRSQRANDVELWFF